jgi:hypothetical protein
MVLGEILLGVLSNAIYDLSKAGVVAFFSGSVADRAIRATARDYPRIGVVADALTRWCKSDEFIERLEAIRAGRTEGADEALVESLVQVGLFHDGLLNTHESARRVLETFAGHLRRELYRSEDGLLIESSRADLRQQETKEGLAALREEVRAGFESLNVDKTQAEDLSSHVSALTTPPGPAYQATLNVLSSQLDSVSSELSDEKLDKLEELRELFREGEFNEAYESVKQYRQSPNWNALSERLRAAVLRALATMTLSLKKADGVAEATRLANEARGTEPSEDDATLRARLKIFTEGHEAALEELPAPTTLDGFNLRLGLLIETDRIEEALGALRRPPTGVAFDAETHRLHALALLASKDLQGAREHIRLALAERPRRLYIRFNAAIIDYFSALSPLVLPSRLVPYPRPVPLSMIKGDVDSRESILRAAEEFKHVAERSTPGSDELKTVEAWHVACLSSLPDLRLEATESCKRRLAEDPEDVRIIPWVLFHGYDVDLSASAEALQQSLQAAGDRDGAELEKLVALLGIHLKQGTHRKALELLEKERDAFSSADELDLWHYWRSQMLIADGQAELALEESSQIEDQPLRHAVRTASLCGIANSTGDWQPLISYLEKSYEEKNDLGSLITLCDIKGQLGDWTYVAERAELYCDAVGTASAARFVFAAAWYAKRPGQCLQLLSKYEALFPNGKLPADLRKLRVHCLINTSNIKGALGEAEKLVQDHPGVESVMLLMDVQLIKGDLTGLEVSARQLLNQGDITSAQLLRAAYLVQLENPTLAKKFWTRAAETASEDPDLTAFAVHMAAKLGVENQRGSLMQRMMEYAAQGQGPMKVMTMEQTLEIMREGRERQEQLQQMYASGEAPLQMLAKGGLAQVFRGTAEWNRTINDAHLRKRILIRHGGRTLLPADYTKAAENWRLHCDTTSLLLAHELGVLDKIEKLFKPLRIPRNVTTALIAQRDNLRPHQPSQLDDSRIVLDLVSKGKLHVLKEKPSDEVLDRVRNLVAGSEDDAPLTGKQDEGRDEDDRPEVIPADAANLEQQLGRDRMDVLAAALSEENFAVGFRPVTCYSIGRHALLNLPEALDHRIVNGRALADSLRGNGRITEDAYEEAVRALGVEGRECSAVIPLIGSKLFLMRGLAEVLAGANLLGRVCDSFNVFILTDCVEEAEAKLQHYEQQAKIESWLSDLIDRISDGLDDGTYEFIGIPDERVAQRDEREEKLDQEFTATLDLFLFEPREWDIIWVDDRALNKYALRSDEKGGIPLVGINEILLALRESGELDKHDYYNLLQRLRESDFRYIPLDDSELIHHLKDARIVNGRVVESDALSALRRYYSSCLLDKEILQLGSTDGDAPNPHSELPFVVQVINAAANAIAAVWADDKADVESATARADWILNNFYTGNNGLSHLRKDDVPRSIVFIPAKIVALDISNLLMRGVGMHGDPLITESVQRRNHYFNWLTERVVASTYGSSPEVIKATAAEMRERFKFVKEQRIGSHLNELFARAFMGKFFLDLPDVISNEMELDSEMAEWLQLKMGSIITAAGINFAADDYWPAVEAALANGSSTIKAQDSETEYRLILEAEGDGEEDSDGLFPTVGIINSENDKVGQMGDPAFGLLLPDVEARRAALEKLRKWFDCGQEEFEREADELSSIEDTVTRLTRLYEWRARSSELYYSGLEQKLRDREPFHWADLLPPSAESFAGRLRLPMTVEAGKFNDVWMEAANALLKEEDLLSAIVRLASVPVAMPDEAVSAVSRLPEGERLELFERLASAWVPPLRRLHLVNLILRSSPDSSAALEIAQKVLAKLYDRDTGAKDFQAFHALLAFVNEELDDWAESRRWSAGVRLSVTWAHACRLHGMFHGFGYSADTIVSMLKGGVRGTFRELAARDSEIWADCAHPHRVGRTRFLTHGVASMLVGIDPSILETAGVPEFIRKEVFLEVGEGVVFPHVSLFGDPALCNDNLLSAFGGDRYEVLSEIIGPEGIEILSSESLKQGVKNYLEEIIADPLRVTNWTWVHMVTDGLPIYTEFAELCRRALETFDPSAARKDGFRPAWVVFRAAATQAANIGDESLQLKFRERLIEALKDEVLIGEEETPDVEFNSLEMRVGASMEVASILSYIPNDPAGSNKALTSLLEAMAGVWPDLGVHYRPMLSREVWNLPVEEGESWWRLTLRLRAAK